MGIFEGLVGGFGKAYTGHQKDAAARTAKQTETEQGILSTLLSSDNPEIQMRAMQAMVQGASGKAKKKGGISGFLGETEPSPAFSGMFDYLKKLDKPGTPEPDTVTDTMEGGVPTQTITAGKPGTPPTLFESSEAQRLKAGEQERAAMTGEIEALGGSPGDVMAGVYRVSPGGAPSMKTIELDDGVYNWDPSTGQLGDKLGEAQGGAGGTKLQRVTTAEGVFAWDPSTGKIATRLGDAPEGAEVPRNRPTAIDAKASLAQIDAALKARFSELDLKFGADSPNFPAIQQAREELAQKFNFPSYAEAQRQAAAPRRDPGLGMPPSANPGISGQGPDADHQRATEIVTAGQAGKVPTPEEKEFVRQYMRMYEAELQP